MTATDAALAGLRTLIAQLVDEALKTAHTNGRRPPHCLGNFPSTRGGWVYAIVLNFDDDPLRLKVGFSSKSIGSRLSVIRTTSPEAKVVGTWDADRHDEERVHRILPGRIGKREVFKMDIDDVERVLSSIPTAIAERIE